jgi:hypothetical protein
MMAVEIAHDRQRRVAVLFCNTSDWAFGPVFTGPGAAEDAQEFLDWLARNPNEGRTISGSGGTDPRDYLPGDLETMYLRWRKPRLEVV